MTAMRIERRDCGLVLVVESGEYVVTLPDCGLLLEAGRSVSFAPLTRPGEVAGAACRGSEGRVVFLFHETWRQVAFDCDLLRRLLLCGDGASVAAEAAT